jgi:hypothetical protein
MEMNSSGMSLSGKPSGNIFAWLAITIFGCFFLLTVLLIGFRMVHFNSDKYDLLIRGFHLGQTLHEFIGLIALIQIVGVISGFLGLKMSSGLDWKAKVGTVGGSVLLLSNMILYPNVSEILIDDLSPAVRREMIKIFNSLNDYHGRRGEFPQKLDEIAKSDNPGALLLKDPYNSTGGDFEYYAAKDRFLLLSLGPKGLHGLDTEEILGKKDRDFEEGLSQYQYDPTNGTQSAGNLIFYSLRH